MTEEELHHLPKLDWMPSRIFAREALAAFVPKGVEFPKDLIPPTYEQRWFPQQDGSVRLLVPYDGGNFNSAVFHIEPQAWDHTTCDLCIARIPAMTVCYVTKFDPYFALCCDCYAKQVVHHHGILRQALWHAKRLVGVYAAG